MAGENHSCALSIVVQAHVPYVLSHGHWPDGEDWLHHAAAESLMPLLRMLHRLIESDVSPRLTVGLSPVLCEMLADLKFPDEFDKYLQSRIDRTKSNGRELASQGFEEYRNLALFWENWHTAIDRDFDEIYGRNLLGAFRALHDDGHIELIASPATQAFLPLFNSPASIEAQVRVGVETFKKHFARQPRGILLPAPQEGVCSSEFLQRLLDTYGLEYFVCSGSHAIPAGENAHPARGLAAHSELSAQALGIEEGYAADAHFLDFDKRHYPGGFRFWRQSGTGANLASKEIYEPAQTTSVCSEQATHWVEKIKAQNQAVVCVPLDGLALGHRWFEGLNWLQRVLKKGWSDDEIHLVTAREAAKLTAQNPAPQSTSKSETSDAWKHENTRWLWEEIDACAQQMSEVATHFYESPNPKLREILDQCARELLLMQDGRWPLLMADGATRAYAAHRVASHINVFECLLSIAETVATGEFMSEGQRTFLAATQERDRCFADVSFALWATPEA